jgi:hypothetical protein
MAHFHIPKPLHGWRAFVGEVGIIVLGVLIALGAEQVVQAGEWRHKVAVTRTSLMGELGNDRARWEMDLVAARCARDPIGKLDAWLQSAGSGAPPSTSDITGRNFFYMHSANWNLATGSETLDHFPIDEQLAFASLYDGVVHRQADIVRAMQMIARVQTLMPLATDSQGRRDLRQALGDLRGGLDDLLANEGYMKRHFDAVGVKADSSDFAADVDRSLCASGRS